MKYGCAESITHFRNGSYQYESGGRGYVTLQPGGRYVIPTKSGNRRWSCSPMDR